VPVLRKQSRRHCTVCVVATRAGTVEKEVGGPTAEPKILYGDFINKLIAFVTIAAAVFFLVVRPVKCADGAAQGRAA
jgi:large-conductance mechanosensitive channel